MKYIKFISLIILLAFLNPIYSQSSNESFLKVKNFYLQKAQKETVNKNPSLHYNRAEKMIDLGNKNVPIKDVQIVYVNVEGVHVVLFKCDGCIISLTKDNKIQELNGFGIPFYNKNDCYQFINLLSNFRDKI